MKNLFLALIGIAVLLIGGGCGQKATPQGGPRDKVPPTVSSTFPEDSTLNYSNNFVRISFSEAIRKPTYGKEIFISPFVERPKIVLSDNAKRLKIDFEEELRPQTTYLVTLTAIKDQNEGNELEEAYILAFSTGDQLDSMEIKGLIVSPEIGKTVEKMTVLLFDSDSIRNDSFTSVRPAYITQSTDKGDFSFKFLRNASYRILGVKDADNSNTYNNPAEGIAITQDSLILFEDDSTNFTTAKLYAFQPDITAPRLNSVLWVSDSTLRVRFNKGLKLDSLKAFSTDTLGQDSMAVAYFSYLQEKEVDVYMHIPRGRDSLSQLHIAGLLDSLGRRLDTTVEVNPFRYDRADRPLLFSPRLVPEKGGWELFLPSLYREQPDWLVLTDTADSPRTDTLKTDIVQNAFDLILSPANLPDSLIPYVLNVSASIADTSLKDSSLRFPLKWFDPTTFGTLSGSVRLDSPYAPPIILHVLNEQKKIVRTVYDTVFSFSLLPAGTYSTQIILDKDSNRVWTPGAIKGRKLPEQIYTPSGTVEIRENWDYADYLIEVLRSGPKKEEPEEGEEEEEDGENGEEGG